MVELAWPGQVRNEDLYFCDKFQGCSGEDEFDIDQESVGMFRFPFPHLKDEGTQMNLSFLMCMERQYF